MEYIAEYTKLYPDDKVVIIGGAAASLHLAQCGIDSMVKDIDVDVFSTQQNQVVLERWKNVLPGNFTAQYDENYPPQIVTFTDTEGKSIPYDIMINQGFYSDKHVEKIGNYTVKRIMPIIQDYLQQLNGSKKDIELIESGIIPWDKDDFEAMKLKYNRLYKRLGLLIGCLKK